MVIYGLPRLNNITLQSSILAFENWHRQTKRIYVPAAEIEEMPDGTISVYEPEILVDEEDYHRGYAAAEVIQAINRVQCRKITDDNGGCSKTDVYLFLNKGDEFEMAILKAVEEEKGLCGVVQNQCR